MTTKDINSPHHPIIKHMVRLRCKRSYRHANNAAVIVGYKMIKELSSLYPLKNLFITPQTNTTSLTADTIIKTTPSIIKKITGMDHPEPIAAEISLPAITALSLEGKNKLLLLDNVSDPGNMGTLIRCAYSFGWDGVIITSSCVDPFNDKTIRSSKGSCFLCPLYFYDTTKILEIITASNFNTIVADIEGTPLHNSDLTSPIILILGNESSGVSDTFKKISSRVTIPQQHFDSLNVAIAGGIIMYAIGKASHE
jgi:RNA methyltransferase, TrmH family